MRKKDDKIYRTLDYICYVRCICIFLILTVLVLAVFLTLAIAEKEVGTVYVVMLLLYGGVFGPICVYYGYKLFSTLSHSDSYVYIEITTDEFSIDKDSLWGFKERAFALKVTVDDKEYVSNKVLNARSYVEAQEEKKDRNRRRRSAQQNSNRQADLRLRARLFRLIIAVNLACSAKYKKTGSVNIIPNSFFIVVAVAIAVAPAVAVTVGRGVANVQANACILSVAPDGQFAELCVAAAFQVAVVFRFHLFSRRTAVLTYGIKIGLFVQKTSVLRASHTKYYENDVNFVKILEKYVTIIYNNVSTLPIILGGNYNGF